MKHGSLSSKALYSAQAVLSHLPGIYAQEALITGHNHDFTQNELFKLAKAAALTTYPKDRNQDWRLHVLLWAARIADNKRANIVECGTNFGWFMRAVCELLPTPITCFDTWDGSTQSENPDTMRYTDCYEQVKKTFAPYKNVSLVRGYIPDSLRPVHNIGLLHIDLNSVMAEMQALRFFWEYLRPGAFVISDDYATIGFEKQKVAWDTFAYNRGLEVLSLPTGQGLLIK